MGVIIEIFIVLAIIGLAIEHKYLVGILIILYILSVPSPLFILAIVLYFLYKNEKVNAYFRLKIYAIKVKREAKKNKKDTMRANIDNFKSDAQNKIKEKYGCEIKFNKSRVKYNQKEIKSNDQIRILKNYVDEKEALIYYLKSKLL